MFREEASSVWIVTAPPLTVDGVDVPVIWSILLSRSWTLSVTLSSLPVAPEATKVMGVPLTVMVWPTEKPDDNESVPGAPDKAVTPVMGAGGVAWLLATLPVAMLSVLKKLSPASTADA